MSSVDTSVEVEFHQFLVQDHDGPDAAVAVEPMPWEDNIVVGGVGGLRIYSSATDHSPSVRLELWDERAPDGLPGWQFGGEARFSVVGQRLRMWSLMGVHVDEDLLLPAVGDYAAVVYQQGREAAERLEEATFVSGVERWVIQIWPASAG
ncbi:MAG TPA: hypothetical protein VGD48_22305 [Kutzneria sp.]